MPFWKKAYSQTKQVWYPRAIVQGDPVETKTIAKQLALISTVSNSDVNAVLGDIATVMYQFMSQGKSVHIEGLGYFRLTIASKGVANEADFDFETQKKAVRVQFIPEREKSASGAITRGMVDYDKLEWIELGATAEDSTTGGSTQPANPNAPATDTTPTVTAVSLGGKTVGTDDIGTLSAGSVAVVLTGTNLADASNVTVKIGSTSYDMTVTNKTATSVTGTITLSADVTDPTSVKVNIGSTEAYSWSGSSSEDDPYNPFGG